MFLVVLCLVLILASAFFWCNIYCITTAFGATRNRRNMSYPYHTANPGLVHSLLPAGFSIWWPQQHLVFNYWSNHFTSCAPGAFPCYYCPFTSFSDPSFHGKLSAGNRTGRTRTLEYGRTYVVRPRGKHQATIVWLHGLGDNGLRYISQDRHSSLKPFCQLAHFKRTWNKSRERCVRFFQYVIITSSW